jgi:hypothetical protein
MRIMLKNRATYFDILFLSNNFPWASFYFWTFSNKKWLRTFCMVCKKLINTVVHNCAGLTGPQSGWCRGWGRWRWFWFWYGGTTSSSQPAIKNDDRKLAHRWIETDCRWNPICSAWVVFVSCNLIPYIVHSVGSGNRPLLMTDRSREMLENLDDRSRVRNVKRIVAGANCRGQSANCRQCAIQIYIQSQLMLPAISTS